MRKRVRDSTGMMEKGLGLDELLKEGKAERMAKAVALRTGGERGMSNYYGKWKNE